MQKTEGKEWINEMEAFVMLCVFVYKVFNCYVYYCLYFIIIIIVPIESKGGEDRSSYGMEVKEVGVVH